MNQAAPVESDLVTLSVRVSRETAERLRVIAEREFRPVAAEMRRLIQERVDADEGEGAAP